MCADRSSWFRTANFFNDYSAMVVKECKTDNETVLIARGCECLLIVWTNLTNYLSYIVRKKKKIIVRKIIVRKSEEKVTMLRAW